MQKYVEEAFKLINNAVMGSNEPICNLNESEWNQVYDVLRRNAVFGMCYLFIEANELNLNIPPMLFQKWKKDTFIHVLNEVAKREELKHILHAAKDQKLKFVLFKGVVLADVFSEPNMRFSGDTDILIKAHQREAAIQLFLEKGYTCKRQKDNVDILSKNNHYIVELHTSLWEDYSGKRIQNLENLKLDGDDKLILFRMGNAEAYTLNHAQHFIYQIYHIAKHFSFESIGIRYLLDISKFYNTFEKDIDLSYLWDALRKTGLEEFSKRLFNICIHTLFMHETIMKDREFDLGVEERTNLLTMFLREDSIKTSSRWDVIGVLRPYFCDEMSGDSKSSIRSLKMLFPSTDQMGKHYLYVKKCKLLLPISWIHRSVDFVGKRNKYKHRLDVSEKLEKANEQIKKMRDIKMID